MKKILLTAMLGLTFVSCINDNRTGIESTGGFEYKIEVIDGCEYIQQSVGSRSVLAHKGNCSNLIHQKDTVHVYGVSIRYGTQDTIFEVYPIDSAEVAIGYLKSNGVLKDITE